MPLLTPEERIGTTVGGYRLDRLIGEGGMGVVFEATHATLETRVAIKLLHPHLTRDEGTVARFEREARSAAKIRHPNVVRILDFVKADDGAACIVMDLLTGESLTDRLKRAPLPPDEAAEILLPIMDAIGFMHEAGIVHRDLKPDNIYLSREAGRIVPKLLDFGIAKVLDDSSHVTRTGMVVGTPAYMSPEQARGSREIGPAVDVWAMGIVWFECMTGHTPFAADGPQAMLAEILTGRPPPLRSVAPHVPPHVAEVVDTALARTPQERFAKMRAFASALEAAFAAPAPSKPPPAKPQQPLPGSPLSATGPMGAADTALATPLPMSPPSVATSDTLLADPNDPTQPSGQQRVPVHPSPQAMMSAATVTPPPPRRRGFALAGMLTGLVVGVGSVVALSSGGDGEDAMVAGSAEEQASAAIEIDVGPPDATADVLFDALPIDAPLDVVPDATELEATEAAEAAAAAATEITEITETVETTMMRARPGMRRGAGEEMNETTEAAPTLPEVAPFREVEFTLRVRSQQIPRVCSIHQQHGQPVAAVTATFTIGTDGLIDRRSIAFERGTPYALQQCVASQLVMSRFPRAQNPTTLTRSFPVQ